MNRERAFLSILFIFRFLESASLFTEVMYRLIFSLKTPSLSYPGRSLLKVRFVTGLTHEALMLAYGLLEPTLIDDILSY